MPVVSGEAETGVPRAVGWKHKNAAPACAGNLWLTFRVHDPGVQTIALPLTEFHHPATFQSRGVAVPFTTPLLAGARARMGAGSVPELVVPNPSGGRGVYIVQWSGVRALCNPTVHDTMLFQRLALRPRIDPEEVRDAALAVASEGYAGQEAAAAAVRTVEADRVRRLRTHFQLLAALIHQVDPNGRSSTPPTGRTAEFDRRASAVLHSIAPAFGCPAPHLATGLDALGDAFAPIGILAEDPSGRTPRLLRKLDDTRSLVSQYLNGAPDNDLGGLGRAVAAGMNVAIDTGSAVLAATRTALGDPAVLLKRWVADPDQTVARAARCDWLLDGWEGVCLLWQSAACEASRRAAMLEMAQILPVMPREIMEWTDRSVPETAMDPGVLVVSHNDGWRRGASAFALVHRNEALSAMRE